MSPKSDVVSSSYLLKGRVQKELAKKQPEPALSQGFAPNPTSPTGSTGNRSAENAYNEIPFQLMPGEEYFYKGYLDDFLKMEYPPERAANFAKQKILKRRSGK